MFLYMEGADTQLRRPHSSLSKSWSKISILYDNAFLQIFKQGLSDSFLQDWNSRLTESSRANFYSLFSSFEHKIYLDCVKV